MPHFDWNEYYTLAKELVDKEGEKYTRACISKAYYAVFNLLCQKITFRDKKDRHQKLIEILKEAYNHQDIKDDDYYDLEEKEWIKIGGMMEDLRKERNHADYDSYAIPRKRALDVLETVEAILEMLEKT